MSPESFFLRIEHLAKTVFTGDVPITILRDINLQVTRAESLAIVGSSGSGKSTLLSLIAGLDLPSQGEITFKNQPIHTLDEEQRANIRGQSIGFIFQSFQLLPSLTALENVMLALEIHYVPHAQARARALNWLNQVGLAKRIHHYPRQLSGGEQQRVAIARAFVNEPELILADEMTGNLDTQTGKQISDILFSMNSSQQTTLILVTHDEHLANRCGRCVKLENGVLESC